MAIGLIRGRGSVDAPKLSRASSLFEFLLALMVLSMLCLRERPSVTNSVLTGLVVGLAILCRSSFILFVPFLFIPYLFVYHFGVGRVLSLAIPILLTSGQSGFGQNTPSSICS